MKKRKRKSEVEERGDLIGYEGGGNTGFLLAKGAPGFHMWLVIEMHVCLLSVQSAVEFEREVREKKSDKEK